LIVVRPLMHLDDSASKGRQSATKLNTEVQRSTLADNIPCSLLETPCPIKVLIHPVCSSTQQSEILVT
jgi:hypothetical protein